MPKIIELTFELNINRVSCPGVWLCQDGMISLSVFALGSSYQTCMLPPVFPLMFKDVFYFRKRFEASCTLGNIFCLLKDETVYCELVQWCGDCNGGKCNVLAQYLGALNEVLFPPTVCSNDGVDLLMRRSKGFPGILAPKIEISTKVRIDEVYDQPCPLQPPAPRINPCACRKIEVEHARQKQVCHTPMFHRCRHIRQRRPHSAGSCCKGEPRVPECTFAPTSCRSGSRTSVCARPVNKCYQYHVFNVTTPAADTAWHSVTNNSSCDTSVYGCERKSTTKISQKCIPGQKMCLESLFIEPDICHEEPQNVFKKKPKTKITPCVCAICKRYYELFHANDNVNPSVNNKILSVSAHCQARDSLPKSERMIVHRN